MRLPLPLPFPFSFGRVLGPSVTLVGILALVFLAVTGRLDLTKLAGTLGNWTSGDPPASDPSSQPKNPESILIASFNIQTFGEAKVNDSTVMAQLATICSKFDIIAVQEVRSPQVSPVPTLVNLMNASGARYTAVVSTQIGRTPRYLEQYAFIYDSSRIQVDPSRMYVMNDELDRMHREPFVASFSVVPQPESTRKPFTFTLINVHTDPDEVTATTTEDNELDVLADVYYNVANWEYTRHGEDDFIMLGDLNAARNDLRQLRNIPNLVSVAPEGTTMVSGGKENDHILINTRSTIEFMGLAGVLHLRDTLNFDEETAKKISDHCPVWAQFSAYEGAGEQAALAQVPNTPSR